MVDYLSDTTECRRLARNVVTDDFDSNQIISYQQKEYSYIATMTDKDDWTSTDREYGALQLIETRLVAADIIQHYGDVETIPMWQAMRDDAKTELQMVIDNMDTETSETDFLVDRTDFKGWGLNSSLTPPNRLLTSNIDDTESF